MPFRTAKIRLSFPKISIERVVLNIIPLFPYKLKIVLELEERDYEARIEFCNCCIGNNELHTWLPNYVVLSDERGFHMDEEVHKPNPKEFEIRSFL